MSPEKMERCLNSVGKNAFVRCFWQLLGYAVGELSETQCAETLDESGFGDTHRRITNATQIFRAGKETDALKSILRSRRSDVAVVHGEALRILSQLRS